MKLNLLYLFTVSALLAATSSARATDTNPPPRLTVELRDGSRVVGISADKSFKFRSELLGNMKLSVQDIRTVDCVSSNSAKLTTVNGDSLTVSFADSEFAVKTSFGKLDLQVELVRKFSVSAGGLGGHPPGMVALWSAEGGGHDSVGGNTAELTDITFEDGQMQQAFSFNGVSSSIRIPASPALDLGADEGFTIMAWIKPSDVNGQHPLFSWSDEIPMNLWIDIRPYENGALMACITDATGNRFLVSHPGVLVSGVFQHIAVTFDKASRIGTWYLNGIVVARRKLAGQVSGTKGDLWISRRDDRPGNWSTGRTYVGLMDEISIYNRALSAEEIQGICADESHGEPLAKPASSDGWYEGWMR